MNRFAVLIVVLAVVAAWFIWPHNAAPAAIDARQDSGRTGHVR